MSDWTETELAALQAGLCQRHAPRELRDGKSVEYGSAQDLLARIRTIETAIRSADKPAPIAGLRRLQAG